MYDWNNLNIGWGIAKLQCTWGGSQCIGDLLGVAQMRIPTREHWPASTEGKFPALGAIYVCKETLKGSRLFSEAMVLSIPITEYSYRNVEQCRIQQSCDFCVSRGSEGISICFNPLLLTILKVYSPGTCHGLSYWGMSCKIALKWMPQNTSDSKSPLVQVMVNTYRQATRNAPCQCWSRSKSLYNVTIGASWLAYNGFTGEHRQHAVTFNVLADIHKWSLFLLHHWFLLEIRLTTISTISDKCLLERHMKSNKTFFFQKIP